MILDKIVEKKKERLEELKKNISISVLEEKIKTQKIPKSFYKAMTKPGLSIIGEIKKASPSKGIIKENFKPIEIAKEYETCVDAISILTEEDFFLGSKEYLKEVNKEVKLPLLRKDFIIDPIQIYEARALGASAVLLIAAILDDYKLKEFINITHSLYMDALIEVHDEVELERVLNTNGAIIGINNRNLKNFSVDINTTIKLRNKIPKDKVVISESGILTKEDIIKLKKAEINGILVGESFMKSENIRKKAEEFKNAYNT
ncbi:indole-3-glycerol phosphate synthase TrpC [Defluviitalea phaphyphila]|uniref:indole-3-glycerol phosphate synthase TrpC n=1 Tax=Defluviitalea phaphyphila TaxID=1473580 RepID=UPI000730F7B1|nr:indole-3-glycerol phosphate synthase TrpC [Defluviitalea phaphyphila]